MKSILTLLVFLTGGLAFAQENPVSLEVSAQMQTVSCDNDQSERLFHLDRTDGQATTSIGDYRGEGCKTTISAALSAGNYILSVSALGYAPEQIPFTVDSGTTGNIVLPAIVLKPVTTNLNEVTIFGNKRQYIKVDADKTTVNVKENGMLNSGNALEAVKKLPGVIASPVGGLTLNGKGVTIYIDGAPSSLSGTDLQNYLAGLPAKSIEKVELIYSPGAAYDANTSGSIINIVTTMRKMKGMNASFNINYNFNKYQKPSPQILLNGKKDRLSWQTMIGYNYIDGELRRDNIQEFTSFNPDEILRQQSFSKSTNRNFYFRTGTNYRLTEKSNLLFNYNLNLGNDHQVNDGTTIGTGIDFRTDGVSKDKSYVHEFSLQYRTKLDTLGRTFDVTLYTNLFGRNPMTQSRAFENSAFTYNNSDADFRLANYYAKFDFAFPFEKLDLSLNTGGKFNVTKVTDFGRYNFSSPTNAIFESDVYASSIDFDYLENNLAFYVEARKKYKKFNFSAGLRFEDFRVKRDASTVADELEFNTTNLFPTAGILYEFNNNINLNATYAKKIAQPGYFTIDPNTSTFFNQYNTSEGNLTLKPVFFDIYELKLTAFQYVQAGVNYVVSKDKNQFLFSADDNELVSNQTFASFDKMKTLTGYVSFPIPLDYFLKSKEEFQKRMNAIETMNYVYLNVAYIKSDVEGFPFEFPHNGVMNYSAQAQIILPWEITNSMSYNFLTKGSWEIYRIDKPFHSFDISFTRSFLDKKLNIGLHCFDVFNTYQVNALIAGQNLNTNFHEKVDSRTFRISLTYNFGNLSLQKDDTNINIEKTNQSGGGLK